MNATYSTTRRTAPEQGKSWQPFLLALLCAAILGVLFLTDAATHNFAAAHRSARLDEFFRTVAPFGHAVFPLLTAPLFLLAGWLRRDARCLRIARGILISALLSGLLVIVAKPLFGRREENDSRQALTETQRAKPREYSRGATSWIKARWGLFPSGDTAISFSTAMPIVLECPPTGWILLPVATLVAFERIYRGVHLASDVFAGAVLACFVARFVMRRLRAASTRSAKSA